MGVYAVRNLVDGALYIGSATDVDARWQQHRAALDRSRHPNDAFQADWIRLGAAAFELVVLERVSGREELAQAEQRWIDRYGKDGVHRVYNAQSRAIRRVRTPLSLDQAARRLHLTRHRLLLWVSEGRVPYHAASSRPRPLMDPDQMGFDREEIDDVGRTLEQPGTSRLAVIVSRLRAFHHRVGCWLHLVSS